MSGLIDCVLGFLLYVLAGVLFVKAYKLVFPESYNFMNWAWDDKQLYDKNRVYAETAYGVAILIYPLIALWLVISRPVILFNKLIRSWLDIDGGRR